MIVAHDSFSTRFAIQKSPSIRSQEGYAATKTEQQRAGKVGGMNS